MKGRMPVLAIDIGNTTIGLTGLVGKREERPDFEILFVEKLGTETGRDAPLFEAKARELLAARGMGRAALVAISSVVPDCAPAAAGLARSICASAPVFVDARAASGLSFTDLPFPDKLGADRIADAAWAAASYPLPAMTVDLGTATTINVIGRGGAFLGGMIGAGIGTSLRALGAGAAQLPDLAPEMVLPSQLIGRDTAACMRSAAVVGTAAMVEGLAVRVEEELAEKTGAPAPLSLVLTGGNAPFVMPWIRRPFFHEPHLAAKGAALIAMAGAKPPGMPH